MVIRKSILAVIVFLSLAKLMGMHDLKTSCKSCIPADEDKFAIFQTKNWKYVINPNQHYLGRSLLVLRNHLPELKILAIDQELEFVVLRCCITQALNKAFGAKTVNILYEANLAFKKDPKNGHVYWHFIPRYSDRIKLVQTLFFDSEWGNLFDLSIRQFLVKKQNDKVVPNKTAKLIMKKIGQSLQAVFVENNINCDFYNIEFMQL